MDGQHDDAYRLAYDEALRGLSYQQAFLDNMRTRAGILLSGAAVARSFLGGQALRTGSFSAWSWIAVSAFGGVGLSALLLLWPWRNWEFVTIPSRVIEIYIEARNPLPLPRIHRDLALHMEASYESNAELLERLIFLLRFGSALLTIEVVAWIVDLATKG